MMEMRNVKGTKDYLPEEQVSEIKLKELVKIRLNDTQTFRNADVKYV